MSTLRRILKYTPAVTLALLVVAWAFSYLGLYVLRFSSLRYGHSVAVAGHQGTLIVQLNDSNTDRRGVDWNWMHNPGFSPGRFSWGEFQLLGYSTFQAEAPFACLLVVMLPLAVGPFISFRFRLWHYLAYTALVAVELAYYLRWQE